MSATPNNCFHLTVEIVREIHAGTEPKADGPEWKDLALAVAASAIDRDEAAQRLRRLLPKNPFN